MFMYGWNSTMGGKAPFLINVNDILEKDIEDFFSCSCGDDDLFCQFEEKEKLKVLPIPLEFGKSQIIKKLFFSIEQNYGGITVCSDGTQILSRPL